MTTKAIHEIIEEVCEIQNRKEKVEYLKKHDSQTLRNILILMYDKSKEFYLPNTPPPYRPSEAVDNHGSMFAEARKLKYFVKGFSDPNMNPIKRESIFINMLESVHHKDAEVLLRMLRKETYKGLTVRNINDAFGEIIKVE